MKTERNNFPNGIAIMICLLLNTDVFMLARQWLTKMKSPRFIKYQDFVPTNNTKGNEVL